MKMKINPLQMNPLKRRSLRRKRKKSKYERKIGMPPGHIVYVGDHDQAPVEVTLIKYNESEVIEKKIDNFEEIEDHLSPDYTVWINVDGINDTAMMEQISKNFKFHPLMTEDIMNTEHFPKSEEYEDHHFFTLKMLRLEGDNGENGIISEHLSLVLGSNYVISFQDKIKGDVFNSVRIRIHSSKARLRKNKADYLFYALIDSAVDRYFTIMEFIREKIEDTEDYVLENPSKHSIDHIITIKKNLTDIRKIVIPLKDAVDRIFLEESDFINEDTYTFLRDVQDHMIHLSGNFDGFRDSVTSLMDMYMSNLSNNLNVIMKTLTIFSLFFVPLTFIAGVYGMNFRHMPELEWKYGYPLVLGVMVCCVILMFLYMRRKGWF
jgi:magnesium transporter